jgi:hypothetical protein
MHRYTTARMLEINSHSLFSKWFSESGKLVQKLFDHITSVLEDEDTFVTVLIGAASRHAQTAHTLTARQTRSSP